MKIRKAIEQAKKLDSKITYQSLAEKIEVEPSYLSRFLGNTSIHFSDELLFRLLSELRLNWSEIDMILLLKEFDRSTNPDRKRFLLTRIRLGRMKRWQKGVDAMKAELASLVDTLNTVKCA